MSAAVYDFGLRGWEMCKDEYEIVPPPPLPKEK
jgi:hypothetical protein